MPGLQDMIRLLPPVALTLVSAASMAVEIVAGRALAPYVGMSLYSWTIIIAVVLAGLSIGHWIGGALADRARPAPIVAVTLFLAALTTFASLWILRLTEPAAAALDPVSHAGALAMAAFFAPSLLAGVISPLLTTMALAAAEPAKRGRVLGLMYALGAFGAILGTLAAGLVLVSWLGSAASLAAIAGLYGALGALFLGRRAGGPALIAFAALGAGAPTFLPAATCDEESAYYCIRIDDVDFLGRPARVMALDHLAHGVNDAEEPRLLLTPYVHGVDELIARRFPGRAIDAFFIGGGAYSLPRAWAARYPEGRLLVAEIDPEVTRLARERLWLGEGVESVALDARAALDALPGDRRFDVIFGDAFHDIAIPQHLVTDEFHAAIRSRLNPGGVYALNVVDALREPRLLLSLTRTLQRRFRTVELWLDAEEVGPVEARTTWIVLASDEDSGIGEWRARFGFERTWLRVPTEAMLAVLPHDQTPILTDDYAPVDRLLAPLLNDARFAEK